MIWKLNFSTYMHIVKYWCNYLDSYKLAFECLWERIAKKLSKKCQHKKQMMTLSKMDFFCINFVFTLLEEASKWDSFKKFGCIQYISISNLRCIIYWYIFCDFLVETSNWPSVVYVSYFIHNVCAQSSSHMSQYFLHRC